MSKKNYQLNTQSVVNRRTQMKYLINDNGETCTECSTETWLADSDKKNLFNSNKESFCCFRYEEKMKVKNNLKNRRSYDFSSKKSPKNG